MSDRRFDLPSTTSLIAFEATVRLGGVIRAANELRTSQSAISRHIRDLERRFGLKLFRRQSRGIVPTDAGEDYYLAVKSSLEELHAASYGLQMQNASVIVACTFEVANELLLPVFPVFRRSFDTNIGVRILNCDYDILPLLIPIGIDIVFEYTSTPSSPDSVKILDEAIMPVASPAFVKASRRILGGHPRNWTGIARLVLPSRGQKWATWSTWFRAHDCDPPEAPTRPFENYQFLLASAVDGEGIAIGWKGFVDRKIESGELVGVGRDWLRTGIGLYASLTKAGRRNPYSTQCMRCLADLRHLIAGKENDPSSLP